MTEKAGAAGAAHDASVRSVDDVLAGLSAAEVEALLEAKRRQERERFYPDQVARMVAKVAKFRAHLADAEAALAAAIDEQRAAELAMDAGLVGD